MSEGRPLLEVEGLEKHYPVTKGILRREIGRVRAVDGISFDVHAGETFGIVGESGCGKSTAATTMLRLEEPTGGAVRFNGEDIAHASASEMKAFRRRAQMIFQDPSSSFDPRMSVGESVGEPLRIHGMVDGERRRRIAQDVLERVGLSASDVDRYPHEFSGGQKQRIALARALVLNPELLVADEPVSALDVSIQAEILTLIQSLQDEFGLAIVFISHNLSVIREVCDRIAVMYLGEIVEMGETEAIFEDPQHPYTRALLSSIPTPNPRQRDVGVRLTGDVPSPANPPSGCRFHTRCPEIIQPESYEFEQSTWRRVMDFRERLETGGVDVEAIATEGETDADGGADEQVVAARIRDNFDLDEPLTDGAAERVLADAIELLVEGDEAAAARLLAEEFATPCENRETILQTVDAGWQSSCHLHDLETAWTSADAVPSDD